MRINNRLTITKRSTDGAFYGERNGKTYIVEKKDEVYPMYDSFYSLIRSTPYESREAKLNELIAAGEYGLVIDGTDTPIAATTQSLGVQKTPMEILTEGINKLMNFFTEFGFTPSFRFTNTFAFMVNQSKQAATDYVRNYFALMDSSYVKEIEQKMKSIEFDLIVKKIAQYGEPTSHINTRLKVYYGSAGTGKTTVAQQEAENRCIVCNSSMLPSDLMEDFIFKDGNPDFNPSLLWDCMEQGKTIVLDEINLLPFDSLRFLQGIVDGKTEFYYKNRPVHIKDGFQIIGTMNLALGGMIYGLPEPLVDRCSETREFILSAEQLTKSITGVF